MNLPSTAVVPGPIRSRADGPHQSMLRKTPDQAMDGGARPHEGSDGADCGRSTGSDTGSPASSSQKRASTAGSADASADEPTVHVVQWVVDLMWQARSWWPNGSNAAART